MLWELAHATRADETATTVEVDAASSYAAIERVRATIPPGHIVLSLRSVRPRGATQHEWVGAHDCPLAGRSQFRTKRRRGNGPLTCGAPFPEL